MDCVRQSMRISRLAAKGVLQPMMTGNLDSEAISIILLFSLEVHFDWTLTHHSR
jgi:hypothetical protein